MSCSSSDTLSYCLLTSLYYLNFVPIPTDEVHESILHVGSEAASCWDTWGTSEVLLTPSSSRGGPHGAKTLTIKSINALLGTITVAEIEANLNDPNTWENGLPELAAEVASLNRPVKFDSVEDENDMHGGHLIVMHTPNVAQNLEGVEIDHFGQQGILGRYVSLQSVVVHLLELYQPVVDLTLLDLCLLCAADPFPLVSLG